MSRGTRAVAYAAVLRWTSTIGYAMFAWSLCHDGTSAGDFTALLVVGSVVVISALTVGWIFEGPGQVDREDEQ